VCIKSWITLNLLSLATRHSRNMGRGLNKRKSLISCDAYSINFGICSFGGSASIIPNTTADIWIYNCLGDPDPVLCDRGLSCLTVNRLHDTAANAASQVVCSPQCLVVKVSNPLLQSTCVDKFLNKIANVASKCIRSPTR
jgi:hypothetical protein